MSAFSGMSKGAKRAWGFGFLALLLALFGMIGFSEWWAFNKNVPAYEHMHDAGAR